MTTVTSVTGVTGWADTFAVAVVVHESRSNPSQPPIAVAEQELTDEFKLMGSQPGFVRNELCHRRSERPQGTMQRRSFASGFHIGTRHSFRLLYWRWCVRASAEAKQWRVRGSTASIVSPEVADIVK
jgi:hypothetical protein